jgi:hypothetical protein
VSSNEDRIFREAVNGFGFTEVEQQADGLYCAGCLCVHKRPTKMYSNDPKFKDPRFNGDGWSCDLYCRFAVIKFFNPEEQ